MFNWLQTDAGLVDREIDEALAQLSSINAEIRELRAGADESSVTDPLDAALLDHRFDLLIGELARLSLYRSTARQ